MAKLSINFDAMPPEVQSLYSVAKVHADEAGIKDAQEAALRAVQLGGWYFTVQGWQKLSDSVLGNTNLRPLEPQPNGQVLVRDVDIFAPTAAHGEVFSADDNKQIIENTNRQSQKPNIVDRHPLKGEMVPGKGQVVSVKESPRGQGWIRGDLLVNSDLAEDWRKRRFTGLSAGIAKDAGGLNQRIGHVALLGADTQGVSGLATTEVFSANYGNIVCFSANATDFSGATMNDVTAKSNKKEAYKAFSHYAASLCAAYASMEAGEKDADKKVEEANKEYSAGQSTFGSEWPDNGLKTDEPKAAPIEAKEEDKAVETPSEKEVTGFSTDGLEHAKQSPENKEHAKQTPEDRKQAESTDRKLFEKHGSVPDYARKHPGEPYPSHYTAQSFAALEQKCADLETALNVVKGKEMVSAVEQQFAAAETEGCVFDRSVAMKLIKSAEYKNVDDVMAMIRSGAKRTASPAEVGQAFTTSTDQSFSSSTRQSNPAGVMGMLKKAGIGHIDMNDAAQLAKLGAGMLAADTVASHTAGLKTRNRNIA